MDITPEELKKARNALNVPNFKTFWIIKFKKPSLRKIRRERKMLKKLKGP